MPELDPAGGVRLNTDEWDTLVRTLFPAPDADPPADEVYNRLCLAATTSRSPHAVNLDYLRACGAALVHAGLPGGSDVPPSDLPGKIRTLGELKTQAEHQARTLAGEVATLTNALTDRLPAVFDTVLEELTDGLDDSRANITPGDLYDLGRSALAVTLRLLDDFDVRDREDTRPADTLCQRRDIYRHPCKLPAGHDGFCEPAGVERPLTVTLWGVPVDADHPAVAYLAIHLGMLRGCDGSASCRRSLIAATLHQAAEDCRTRNLPWQSLSANPTDYWIRRTAERLADIVHDAHNIGSLADLIRDAILHAGANLRLPTDG